MTLEELKMKLPQQYRPLVDQYGPTFLAMGATEVTKWITRIASGDTYGAYQQVLAAVPNDELIVKMQSNLSAWDKANADNVARMDVMGQAATAILKVLVGIAAATVGL